MAFDMLQTVLLRIVISPLHLRIIPTVVVVNVSVFLIVFNL